MLKNGIFTLIPGVSTIGSVIGLNGYASFPKRISPLNSRNGWK